MRTLVVIAALLVTGTVGAQQATPRLLDVALSQGSSRIHGTELRTGRRTGALRFFSLRAAEKALGPPEDSYVPRGVRVYAWRSVGVHLQRGWRGQEKGKLFKLQVYFEDDYDRFVDKHTGRFTGSLSVDGLDIPKGASLESLRSELQSRGYTVGEDKAEKGEITILAMNPTRTIMRVEQWCL